MAEIFLSYANEDREMAGKVAALLESAGWTVWWDRRIPAGRTWRSVIEDALGQMRCMVVLWSSHSVDSHWVKEEAEEARALEKLVPVLIEPVNPPVGFRSIQAADLTDWDGSHETQGSRQLIGDIESLIGKPVQATAQTARTATLPVRDKAAGFQDSQELLNRLPRSLIDESPTARMPPQDNSATNWLAIGASGVGLAIALGAYWYWPKSEVQPPPPIVAAPQTPEPPALQQLVVRAPQSQLKVGETLALQLEAVYADGTKKQVSDAVRWEVSDGKVASVDGAGELKALQPGITQITGRYGERASGAWTLNIEAAPVAKAPETAKLVSLAISGAPRELRAGEKLALRAKGKYSDGSEKALNNIDWQSSDAYVVAVSNRGEIDALRAGRAEVRARAGAVTSAPLVISVAPAPVKSVKEKPVLTIPQSTFRAEDPSPPYSKPAPPPPPVIDSSPQRIAGYLNRAREYRVNGNYAAALAELEKARVLDPSRADIREEIAQTRKACNAEKSLGYNVNC